MTTLPTLTLFDQAMRKNFPALTPTRCIRASGEHLEAGNDGDLTAEDIEQIVQDMKCERQRDVVRAMELELLREKLRDEYRTGLDKVGPQWERDEDYLEGEE